MTSDQWDSLAESEAMLLEPRSDYDSCIVALAYRFHDGPVAAYDIEKVLAVLRGYGMTEEEAEEWFEFNTIGAWVGEGTPVFIHYKY